MKLGAAVVATDLPELLPHMEYNLQLNDEGLEACLREQGLCKDSPQHL